MKKIIALIVAVLFVFAVASVSIAAEEKKAAPAPAEKKAEPAKKEEKKAAVKVMSVSGEVAAVDAAAKTITVKGKKGDVVITVDAKTLADVKAGDKVKATYTSADGKNTAKTVKKAAAAKKKAEKKAEPMKAEPAKPAESKK
ncbi:MAG: hypothetical protein HY035_09865 [Nitrospirae bacterium]|nr:hypothetical protein [Nitrospirota bacterium]MBI3378684.1 hypothetical protein [Nitrospirota bacterium]